MTISLNEIAQHSGEALSQINWTLASIAIAVVGCWILAECIEVFEDRRRARRRFARSLV
jgi:hypothetical protein